MTQTPHIDWLDKRILAGQLFTPSAPIQESTLLVGRQKEIDTLLDAFISAGRHAILYGDRGVGKTSLANVFLRTFAKTSIQTAKVTCTSEDTTASILQKLARQVAIPISEVRKIGFGTTEAKAESVSLDRLLDSPSADSLVRVSGALPSKLIFTVDEFDRIHPLERKRFADTIKVLSDNNAPVKLLLVAVAESIEGLISDHASIERVLAQIAVPRLQQQEAEEILRLRFGALGMQAEQTSLTAISFVAQGLPHLVHLLGLGVALTAIGKESTVVSSAEVSSGVGYAINQTDHSLVSAYQTATYSPRKDALFSKVLASCALATTDPLGYFNAQSILPLMRKLHGSSSLQISAFNNHLDKFCTVARAQILEKTGQARRKRYRFKTPMMRSFSLLRALQDNIVSVDTFK